MDAKQVTEALGLAGIVPVVVLDDAAKAPSTADALMAGGIGVMEITLRTEAGLEAIHQTAQTRPDMLVGAGTVLSVEQCRQSVAAGARFIVTPGFDEGMVKWCLEKGVAVVPGCVTPTEIMAAMALGLRVLKFFPAGVYGGLPALKALAAPFGQVRFIPTGGVDTGNIAQFAASPFVHAVGGSWVCPKAEIEAENYGKITALCRGAVQAMHGFELAHVGLNMADANASMAVAESFGRLFGFEVKPGASSNFAGSGIEVMKSPYLGKNGHLAIATCSLPRAVAALEKQGFGVDETTTKTKNGRTVAIYLKDDIGGFAVHLLQK